MTRTTVVSVVRLSSVVGLVLAACVLWADGGDGSGWWPHFHGPNWDNLSTEKGLLREWPKEGPPLIWKFPDCGRGYAGVAIADGMIFTAGDFADKEMLLALDLNGKLLWKSENGKSWKGAMPGSRTTPTYCEGVLYHMNPTGRLAAYDAKSGQEKWAVDLKTEYGAEWGTWAMSENILLDGNVLFCAPGGSKGRIVAMDKTTGSRIWANTEIADHASYCTPILVTHGREPIAGDGRRQLITILHKSIVSVDAQTGKLLWTHRHETKNDQNVTKPIFKDGYVYASSGHGTGGRLLKLSADGRSVTEVWLATDQDNCHGGVILLDGCLYGHGCRLSGKGLVCVDFQTGKTLWNEKTLGKVSITYADGMLYCLSDTGKMSLVEANRERCRIVSQFGLPRESGELHLFHPVVCGGRLYVRHWNTLFAYDLRAGAGK
jgi:outer membrane protein assembly factor BamB